MCHTDLLQHQASGNARHEFPLPNGSLVDASVFGKPCAAFPAQTNRVGAQLPTESAHGHSQVTGRLRKEALRIDQLAFGARRFAPVQECKRGAAMGVTVDEDTCVIPVGLCPLGGIVEGAVPGRHFARRLQIPPLPFDEITQPMRLAATSPETVPGGGRPPKGFNRAADGANPGIDWPAQIANGASERFEQQSIESRIMGNHGQGPWAGRGHRLSCTHRPRDPGRQCLEGPA